ncbi:hypothetical protein Bpfe_026678, partial [Biomphalaria pfeifferi]
MLVPASEDSRDRTYFFGTAVDEDALSIPMFTLKKRVTVMMTFGRYGLLACIILDDFDVSE